MGPLIECVGDELRPVVHGDGLRVAIRGSQLVENPRHVKSADAALDDDAWCTTGEGVDEGEDTEAVAIGGAVEDEIHGPALAGSRDRRQDLSGRRGEPPPPLHPDGEPLLAVDSVDCLWLTRTPSRRSSRPIVRYPARGRVVAMVRILATSSTATSFVDSYRWEARATPRARHALRSLSPNAVCTWRTACRRIAGLTIF